MEQIEFQQRIAAELKSLDGRDTDLAAKEDTIRRERAEIRARINDLTRVVTIYQEFMGLSAKAGLMGPETVSSTSNGSKPTRTIADIAHGYIVEHGGRAKVSDILAELVRVRRLAGKHGDYGTVFGTLSRNPKRFMKVGTGEFAVLNPSAPERPI